MPKYLICGSYTAEGMRGLQKDKASGRRQAVSDLMESMGGRLEAMYYALGEDDVFVVVDAPSQADAAAIGVAASASGMVRLRTIQLLTVEETDQILSKTVNYRTPGA